MSTSWRITVIYETHCTICDAVDRQRYTLLPHDEMPRPTYPVSWHTYDFGAICHRHNLMISFPDASPDQILQAETLP